MSTVSHLSTGYISPQFHLVLDDLFETFIRTRDHESVFNAICNDLFELNKNWYAEDKRDDTGKLIYQHTPLEDIWLDEKGRRDCMHELENQRRRQEDSIFEKNSAVPDMISFNKKDKHARPPTGAPVSDN